MPEAAVKSIPLESILGFNGFNSATYHVHPDGSTAVYTVGAQIIIQGQHKKQSFLLGHSRPITSLAISPSGKFLATGEETNPGFKAELIIWNFETKQQLHKLNLQKGKIQALAFSPDEKFLISLGGEDDNDLILINVENGAAVSGAVASKDTSGHTISLAYSKKNPWKFATGGDQVLRVWDINPQSLKMVSTDCKLGNLKRVVNCIDIDATDEMMYCGTSSGDLMQINFKTCLLVKSGPLKPKEFLGGGITSVKELESKSLVYVGSGSGTVATFDIKTLGIKKSAQVNGAITSLAFKDNSLHVATKSCNIYHLHQGTIEGQLVATNHSSPINAVAFPNDCSDLFVTASDSDIRLWNLHSHKELLRISEPGLSCKSVIFKANGSSIITGWSDGKIRAYGPETGKLQFVINDAHKGAVTAISPARKELTDGSFKLVSGGEDGQVRVWLVEKQKQKLLLTMKEHKGPVTAIHFRHNDKECVTSSNDGSCILWNLERGVRIQILFTTASFKNVKYFPDESQILTVSSDGKIGYWESYDGTLIRDLETNPPRSLNALDISVDGNWFVTGGIDKKIKLYRYDEGVVEAIGVGHSSDITKILIAPNQKKIISTGTDGSIFIWEFPFAVGEALKSF